MLKTLHKLGSTRPSRCACAASQVAPRDVVAAALPDPGDARRPDARPHLRRHVRHRAPARTGSRGATYLYHVVDNEETMRDDGAQAVVWQTAINPVVALELLASGTWAGTGVLGPEAFDAVPFLDLLADYGSPHGVDERDPVRDSADGCSSASSELSRRRIRARGALRAGALVAPRRCAHALDDALGRRLPGLRRARRGTRGSAMWTGIEYVDLCLGDTGAMTGHSPAAASRRSRNSSRAGSR